MPIALSIATGPAGAKLGGTTTVAAVNGVANFRGLTFNVAGTYTLRATSGTLTADLSNSFAVAPNNVTAALTISVGTFQSAGNGVYKQTVTIANVSGAALSGPHS